MNPQNKDLGGAYREDSVELKLNGVVAAAARRPHVPHREERPAAAPDPPAGEEAAARAADLRRHGDGLHAQVPRGGEAAEKPPRRAGRPERPRRPSRAARSGKHLMRLPALRLPSFRCPPIGSKACSAAARCSTRSTRACCSCVFLIANFPHNVIVAAGAANRSTCRARACASRSATRASPGGAATSCSACGSRRPTPTRCRSSRRRASTSVPASTACCAASSTRSHLLGLMYGGAVDGTVAMGDGMRRATVTVDGLQLQRYPARREPAAAPGRRASAGNLSGVITIESHGADNSETRAAAEIDLDEGQPHRRHADQRSDAAGAALRQGGDEAEPAGRPARGAGARRQRPRAQLSLSGQIALREPLNDSVLNLKLTALPGAEQPRGDADAAVAPAAAAQGRQARRAAHDQRHAAPAAALTARPAPAATASARP